MKLKLSALLLVAASIVSCNKYKVTTTEDGSRLQVHTKGKSGKLAKDGDIIDFDLIIKSGVDSTIKNSIEEGSPIVMPIQKGFFKGSFENALYHIGEGDSTTVLVSADSLFKSMGQAVPAEFGGPGKDMKFIVRMNKITSQAEFEKELADKKANEPKIIQEFVSKNLANAQKATEGDIFYVVSRPGAGAQIKNGDEVAVKYEGRFLDGKVFDKSGDQTINVKVGAGMVIPGWEMALRTMKVGTKGTYVIPSDLAYGERGVGPIAANTPLVFDIEVVEVVK